jgi:hypothetical protein
LIGTLFEQKELGTVSLNFDVDGKALNGNFLILQLLGDISQIEYKNYNYTNIVVNGTLKSPNYKGQISINDNLTMTFDGLLDLSKRQSL